MSDTLRVPKPVAEQADEGLAVMLRGDQRLRWLQGQRIPVEAYIEHYPELHGSSAAMQQLLLGEIGLRRELREPLDLADLCRRFPGQENWLEEQLARVCDSGSTSEHGESDDRAELHWPALPGYEIIEEIGRGGMGVVYKARQIRLNRFVALKVLLSGVDAGPKARARFRSEAQAAARAQHPYIVQILDVIEQDGQLFLSLEFVGGGSLARQIAGRPQPIERAVDIVLKLARGIQFAHEQGIVHRDLKPANILLTDDGIPKVADFGLAKRLDADASLTQSGAVLGTPDYMAPEQAHGRTRDIGPATDVYALGSILYEMLIGRAPFRGEAMIQVLDAVRFQKPRPPRELRSDVPRDLERVCLKCLEKEPARRYRSAAALADDLERFQAGEPVTGGQIAIRGWMRRWLFRATSRRA